jgi:hypothetical protein
MKNRILYIYLLTLILSISFLSSCKKEDEPDPGPPFITLQDVQLDSKPFSYSYSGASITPTLVLKFSEPIDPVSAQSSLVLSTSTGVVSVDIQFINGDSTLVVKPSNALKYLTVYYFEISSILKSVSQKKQLESKITIKIVTTYNTADKFERISDTALLDSVQKRTLKYFYNFAHPVSGMARSATHQATR